MFIKGYYIRDSIIFKECEIYIERAKIHSVIIADASPIVKHSYIPNDKSKFNFERLPKYNTGIIPIGSNYFLEYVGKGGNINRAYLSLNRFQKFKVKWTLGLYLIQSKDMKTDIIKYFIGAIIGGVITLLFSYVSNYLP